MDMEACTQCGRLIAINSVCNICKHKDARMIYVMTKKFSKTHITKT